MATCSPMESMASSADGMPARAKPSALRCAPLASGQGAVSALVALPNNALLSGGDDGSMRLWSEDGQLRRFLGSGHSSIVSLLRRNDGSILSGGSERLISGDRNLLRSWSFKEQLTRGSRQLGAMENLSIVELCNGDLISGDSDGRLHDWRGTRRLNSPIKTTHERVYALTVLPTQDLVSGGDDGTIQVWRDGQPIRRFPTRQKGVSSLTSLKDGTSNPDTAWRCMSHRTASRWRSLEWR
jgi:WD40 repeat protein